MNRTVLHRAGTIYAINPATIIIMVPFLSHVLSPKEPQQPLELDLGSSVLTEKDASHSGNGKVKSPGAMQQWMSRLAATPPCSILLQPLQHLSTMDVIALGTSISSASALIIVSHPSDTGGNVGDIHRGVFPCECDVFD